LTVRRVYRGAALGLMLALAGTAFAGGGVAMAGKGGGATLVTSQLQGPAIPSGQPVRGLVHLRVRANGPERLTAVFTGVAKPPSDPTVRYLLGLSRRSCAELSTPGQQVVVGRPNKEVVPDQFGNGSAYLDDTDVVQLAISKVRRARSMVLARSTTTQGSQLAACGRVRFWAPVGKAGESSAITSAAAKGGVATSAAARGGGGLITGELGPTPGQTAQGIVDFRVGLKSRPGGDRPVVRGLIAVLIGLLPAEQVALSTAPASCSGAPAHQNGWVDGVSTVADTFGNALVASRTFQANLRTARSVAVFRNLQGSWLACGPLGFWILDPID
jgi:hypothetical protein